MNKQETISDIIAWLRRPREGENAYLTVWRDEIADRIEAAHRRERELTKPAEIVNSGAASDTAGNGDWKRKYTTERHPWMSWGKCVAEYQKSKEAGEYGPY